MSKNDFDTFDGVCPECGCPHCFRESETKVFCPVCQKEYETKKDGKTNE